MQRNSTSTIVGRLTLAVTSLALVHFFARLVWYLQWFNLNGGDTTSYRSSWAMPPVIKPTSFWEYTNDVGAILGTHTIGVVITTVLIVTGYWIFFDSPVDSGNYICTDPRCTCGQHQAQVFKDGEWDYAGCTNPACKCAYHTDEKFVDGTWQ
jgi:hypothetical protein